MTRTAGKSSRSMTWFNSAHSADSRDNCLDHQGRNTRTWVIIQHCILHTKNPADFHSSSHCSGKLRAITRAINTMSQSNEPARLHILDNYQVLDTAAEKTFDDLTRLASVICKTPMGLVSLVDDHRQWFKARVGVDVKETPREAAFCAHALEAPEFLIVEDALQDERFQQNPLVTGEPNIRFYAGAPLTVQSGHNLGTLCVLDTKPRTLSGAQLSALGILRDAVVAQLELRRSLQTITALQSTLPMCAWCRSVQTESSADGWQPLHEYVANMTKVSHGICPSCRELMEPGPGKSNT